MTYGFWKRMIEAVQRQAGTKHVHFYEVTVYAVENGLWQPDEDQIQEMADAEFASMYAQVQTDGLLQAMLPVFDAVVQPEPEPTYRR